MRTISVAADKLMRFTLKYTVSHWRCVHSFPPRVASVLQDEKKASTQRTADRCVLHLNVQVFALEEKITLIKKPVTLVKLREGCRVNAAVTVKQNMFALIRELLKKDILQVAKDFFFAQTQPQTWFGNRVVYLDSAMLWAKCSNMLNINMLTCSQWRRLCFDSFAAKKKITGRADPVRLSFDFPLYVPLSQNKPELVHFRWGQKSDPACLEGHGRSSARVYTATCASRTHRGNDSPPYGPPTVVSHSKSAWSLYKPVPSRLVQQACWDPSLSSWLASPQCIKRALKCPQSWSTSTLVSAQITVLCQWAASNHKPLGVEIKVKLRSGLCFLVDGTRWDIKWTKCHLSISCLYSAVCLD